MKTLIIFFITFSITMAQTSEISNLYEDYGNYYEKKITKRWFNQHELFYVLDAYNNSQFFRMEQIGKSFQGREIRSYTYGNGPVKILAWSQMHGDEPTATMGIADIMNFLVTNDKYNDFRRFLAERTTIIFIPMLNPDGARVFRRRNAQDIDINRDALRLQAPESRILKEIHRKIKPDFGFNLHDQSPNNTAGKTNRTTALAFLAPAYNSERQINTVRGNAMAVICSINEELQKYIPGHVARYDDEFEERAFGDNFTKWGTSTILIESGGWTGDEDKQYLRKLNFISLLKAFGVIAEGTFHNKDYQTYEEIPENKRLLFDLLLTKINTKFEKEDYKIDIGINFERVPDTASGRIFFKGIIEDIGDLGKYYGHQEVSCENCYLEPGRFLPEEIAGADEYFSLNYSEALQNGILFANVLNISGIPDYPEFPIVPVASGIGFIPEIRTGLPANFIITSNGKTRFVVINGFLFNPLMGDVNLKNNIFVTK